MKSASVISPLTTRYIATMGYRTCFPVGLIPRNAPRWVPVTVYNAQMLSPSVTSLSMMWLHIGEGVDECRHEDLVALPGRFHAEALKDGKFAVLAVERPQPVEVVRFIGVEEAADEAFGFLVCRHDPRILLGR